MSIQNTLSLLLIAVGVALCAAFGGQLPEATKHRETLKLQRDDLDAQLKEATKHRETLKLQRAELDAQLKVNSEADAIKLKLSKVSAEFDATPPQAPQERLSDWLSSSALPFGLGCLLIIFGAVIARRNEQVETSEEGQSTVEAVDFGVLLSQITAELKALYEGAKALHSEDSDGAKVLRERIQLLQRGDLERLIEARGRVRAKHGVATFAELYGSISQGERRLNRAWSALTDAHIQESINALEGAHASLVEAQARLQALT